MELNVKAALVALRNWRDLLTSVPLTYAEFPRPAWAFADAVPVLEYRSRGCKCYVLAFKRPPVAGMDCYVLNADWLKAQRVYGGSKVALAAALSIVATRPAPTRANGRREV